MISSNQDKVIIIMKFGGTSVGSAECMEQVIKLVTVAIQQGNIPFVVLSAMAGVTNLLIEGAELSHKQELNNALLIVEKIKDKHYQVIEKLFSNSNIANTLKEEVLNKIEELAVLYKGVSYLGELSKRSLDAISGIGELLSSLIVAKLAEYKGLGAQWLDARKMLITTADFGQAKPLWEKLIIATNKQAKVFLDNNKIIVTQGFIGSTADGISTTLGRGGSDYSASIFGVALNASEIQIWTDVDGMMSADPRIVADAKVLSEVSFQEASELAYFGAKVLHPMTIHPAVEKNISVRILNTLNPTSPGTIVKAQVDSNDPIRAIAAKKKITAIYLNTPNMLMSHGYLAKVFEIFNKHKVPVDLIATSEVSLALTIDSTEQINKLEQDLKPYADVQIFKDVAIVSVVGRQFRKQSGIANRIFKALNNINILIISGGASDINLSFVVSEQDSDKSVYQLHKEFFSV